MTDAPVTRRAALRTLAAAAGATLLGERWVRTWPADPPVAPFAVPGAATLAPGEAMDFHVPRTQRAGLLVRLAADAYVAFDRRCPHLGCPVLWSAPRAQFECPCHAAVFDAATGRVVTGPPREGLRRFEVDRRDGALWVRATRHPPPVTRHLGRR
jgi:Rieske Fe-S protein